MQKTFQKVLLVICCFVLVLGTPIEIRHNEISTRAVSLSVSEAQGESCSNTITAGLTQLGSSILGSFTSIGVPTVDYGSIAKDTLDCALNVGWQTVKRAFIGTIQQGLYDWIEGGFQGKPLFLEDPDVFFDNLEDYAIDELFTRGNELVRFLCKPIQIDIALELRTILGDRPELQCTLDDISENIEDFEVGVIDNWEDLVHVTYERGNNPLFVRFYAKLQFLDLIKDTEELYARIRGEFTKDGWGAEYDEGCFDRNIAQAESRAREKILKKKEREGTGTVITQEEFREIKDETDRQLRILAARYCVPRKAAERVGDTVQGEEQAQREELYDIDVEALAVSGINALISHAVARAKNSFSKKRRSYPSRDATPEPEETLTEEERERQQLEQEVAALLESGQDRPELGAAGLGVGEDTLTRAQRILQIERFYLMDAKEILTYAVGPTGNDREGKFYSGFQQVIAGLGRANSPSEVSGVADRLKDGLKASVDSMKRFLSEEEQADVDREVRTNALDNYPGTARDIFKPYIKWMRRTLVVVETSLTEVEEKLNGLNAENAAEVVSDSQRYNSRQDVATLVDSTNRVLLGIQEYAWEACEGDKDIETCNRVSHKDNYSRFITQYVEDPNFIRILNKFEIEEPSITNINSQNMRRTWSHGLFGTATNSINVHSYSAGLGKRDEHQALYE